jgi:riboflavin biosynthesis pyrimidine reductase
VVTARQVPTLIVTQQTDSTIADLFRDAGVHLIATENLRDGFRRLRAAGVRALMVEGGAAINHAVFAERLAHRMIIIQAPVTLGPGALPAFESATPEVVQQLETLRVLDRRALGPDTMTIYALAET